MSEQKLPEPQWVDSRQNQFGITLLDMRRSAHESTAWTTDKAVVETFARLRRADGAEYANKLPEDCVAIDCSLSYDYPGSHGEGPVFKAKAMEDKWDMYIHGDRLYISRSWTGDLCFVAPCEFKATSAEIHRIFSGKRIVSGDFQFAVRVVDYLIKSHMSNMAVPTPCPPG